MDKTLFMFWCLIEKDPFMVWNEALYGTGIKISCFNSESQIFIAVDNLAAWTLNHNAGQGNGEQILQMISKFV